VSTSFESIEAFEAAIRVVPSAEAEGLRARFIERRLDSQDAEQASHALRLRRFSDGLAYTGYLWDFLMDKHVVSEETLWQNLQCASDVYAMWDLHSTERIRIPDYFKFPRATVIQTTPATLRRGLAYLPEDLYIFDESCSWSAALTHEWPDDRRFCLWSGTPSDFEASGGRSRSSRADR